MPQFSVQRLDPFEFVSECLNVIKEKLLYFFSRLPISVSAILWRVGKDPSCKLFIKLVGKVPDDVFLDHPIKFCP